jgi:hypothetical protein
MKHTRPLGLAGTLLLSANVALAPVAGAQSKVPVMALAPVSIKSADTFGAILNVRQLPSGNVLVNDAGRRRLLMLDPTLTKATVVIDSTAGTSNSYGPRATPLISYLGDSSLFVDAASSSLLVIDPKGAVSRVMSAPKPGDLQFLGNSPAYVDNKGRLLYRGAMVITRNRSLAPGEKPAPIVPPDSAPIVRADFDTRQIDTVAKVKLVVGGRTTIEQGPDGKMSAKMVVNPVQTVDDWTVLADGSLAFVRGHDYHVDVIDPSGKEVHGSKLPFDWKRLTDDDKQKLIDSARTAQENAQKTAATSTGNGNFSVGGGAPPGGGGAATEVRMVIMAGSAMGGGGAPTVGGGDGGAPGPGRAMTMTTPKIEFPPLSEIADYYPAIRNGAAKPDLEGNLWVLTTTTAQSQNGELVYDVINNKGELTHRVRLPAGRSVAGFGKGGVVYLQSGDRTNGFVLERTSVVGGGRATQDDKR